MRHSIEIEDELITLFAGQIRERLGGQLKQIVLFGSRARESFDPESDYDFLIVVDEISEAIREALEEVSSDFLYRYDTLFSAIPVSEERFSKERYSPLLMNVRREGIVI